MTKWAPGYTRSELIAAQERHNVRFPPDLVELLLERRPIDGLNWSGDDARISEMLNWPLKMLLADVDEGSWWTDWGERPATSGDRHEVVRSVLARVPRLIPIYSHRFMPETPSAAGNPVFSMYGFDTIYYGANLAEYFANEFDGGLTLNGIAQSNYTAEDARHLPLVPFWSDLALHWDRRIEYAES